MLIDYTQESLNDCSSQSCSVDHGGCNCAAVIKSLKSELSKLQETVKLLSSQVNAMSSTLGVAIPTQTTSIPANAAVSVTDDTRKSYASAAASDVSVVRQIHRNMVSAVYLDLEEKKKRASNVIICGLKADEAYDDKVVAAGMIWHELGKQVTIKACRRLGKKVPDKTQNLLVTLSSADEATLLLSNAKLLRRSENEFVRRNIFINPDQTPAEAKAAYDLRCARRSRRTYRRTDGTYSTSVDISAYHTSLSVSAAPYVPTSSTSSRAEQSSSGSTSAAMPVETAVSLAAASATSATQ